MYNLFKFLHIVAAMFWIGGVLSLVVINARLARSQNRAATETFAQQAEYYGRFVLGPAAGTTLLAGIITAILGHIRFDNLWILWGLAGIAASMILGAVFINRTTVELNQRVASAGSEQTGWVALQRRLANLNLINLLLLLSVVLAMVFKPHLLMEKTPNQVIRGFSIYWKCTSGSRA